jgi:predicted RNA-binding protein YlxR (DUF448 family)
MCRAGNRGVALQAHLQIEIVKLLWEEDKDRARPVRQCAVGRTRSPEDDLLRFVLDPDKRVVPDLKRKLPGRGVWVTANRDAVSKAVRQKSFARGFRQAVTVDPDLAEAVDNLLRRAALQDLALANKAGCIVAGFTKVQKALTGERRMQLLHAVDAAPDGRRKLDRMVEGKSAADIESPLALTGFTSSEVSAALGRHNVMHAAITQDGAGRKFIGSALRYMRYAGAYPDNASLAGAPEQDWE